MTDERHETTLEALLSFGNGQSSPSRTDDGSHPVFGSNGLIGFAEDTNAEADTIVIGRVGSYCGSLHYSKTACWVTDNAIRANALGENDSRFLYFLLESCNLHQWRGGSGQPLLNQRTLKSISVRVPEAEQQARIGRFLGSLDDQIAVNRRLNRALEKLARALFKSWFIDFEPVNAKAQGATDFPGMPLQVFEQLPDQLNETEHGAAPAGWEYVPVGELVAIAGGGTPSTKNPTFWDGGDNAFCTPKDMSRLNSPVLLDTERHITQAGVDKISSGQLPVGTVLLSSRAPIGYLALAATPVSVNQGIIAMKTGAIPNSYVLLWTEANMDVIKSRAGGSTFAEISKRNFRPIPALRPDDATLHAFGDATAPLFEMITANERESAVLAGLRDALLPRLISGEVTVTSNGEVNHGE